MKKCVFAGTFDPPTTGHKHIIDACLKIFDEVVVAVMRNPQKSPYLAESDRIMLLNKLYPAGNGVKVCAFDGAVVDLLERENTVFYVRGIRDGIDLDYEMRDLKASKNLKPDLIGVFIPADGEYDYISSTLVKTSIKLNKPYSGYIPAAILNDFEKLINR